MENLARHTRGRDKAASKSCLCFKISNFGTVKNLRSKIELFSNILRDREKIAKSFGSIRSVNDSE